MQGQAAITPQVVSEIIGLCLDALNEAKSAYHAASQQQARVIELEKVASQASSSKIDAGLVQQTVRNLVASSFLDAAHSEKLSSEIQNDPSVALRLVQRFIEISTPPFSEGHGVQKTASEDNNLGDPDGWTTVLSKGA